MTFKQILGKIPGYLQHLSEKYIFGIRLSKSEAIAYSEQVVYRRSKCPGCVEAGACIACGCEIDGMMTTSSTVCPNGQWGKILKTKEWEQLKESLSGFAFGFYQKNER